MMIHVSEPRTDSPLHYKNELQFLVYKTLNELQIPYQRVDTDEVITMEDCSSINQNFSLYHPKMLQSILYRLNFFFRASRLSAFF